MECIIIVRALKIYFMLIPLNVAGEKALSCLGATIKEMEIEYDKGWDFARQIC